MDTATANPVHINALRDATVEHLQALRDETRDVIKGAKALGVSPTVIAQFEGTFNGAQTSVRKRAPTRARSRPGGGRRTDATAQDALTWLEAHPGISAKQLAGSLNANPDTVLGWLKDLEGSGRVRREGERNQTRWFVAQAVLAGAS